MFQDNFKVVIQNEVSTEKIFEISNLAETKLERELRLKDYNSLMKPSEIKKLFARKEQSDMILNLVEKRGFKLDKKLGLIYNLDCKDDPKLRIWTLVGLIPTDSLKSLHLAIDKSEMNAEKQIIF